MKMPRIYYCRVPNCRSTSQNKNISFHNFPRNKDKRLIWSRACDLPDNISPRSRICSLHFSSSMFVTNSKRSLLHPSAIPTLFDCRLEDRTLTAGIDDETAPELVGMEVDFDRDIHIGAETCVAEPDVEMVEFQQISNLLEKSPATIHPVSPERSHTDHSYFQLNASHMIADNPASFDPGDLSQMDSTFTVADDSIEDVVPLDQQVISSTPKRKKPINISRRPLTLNRFGYKRSGATPRKKNLLKVARDLRLALRRKEQEVLELKKKVEELQTAYTIAASKAVSPLLQMFIEGEETNLLRKPQGHRWTDEQKRMAVALYKKSPKTYRFISTFFPLPSKSTIDRLLQATALEVGISHGMIKTLSDSALVGNDRKAVLIVDEVSLFPEVTYDANEKVFRGFVDFGDGDQYAQYADHALVFMLQGICKKWKMPIAFYFTRGTVPSARLAELFKTVIDAVLKANFDVVATICDMGKTNTAALDILMKSSGGSVEEGYFKVNGKIIRILIDICHLLKIIRNNLLKYDFQFGVKHQTDANGKPVPALKKIASWRPVQKLYIVDKACVARTCPRLTDRHIYENKMNKMKVKLASQVFSHSVYAAMTLLADSDVITDPKEKWEMKCTAEFIKFFDNLFDSLNGSTHRPADGKPYRRCFSKNCKHKELWQEAQKIIGMLKLFDKHKQVHAGFKKWFLITLKSMISICTSLNVDCNIMYIATRNFNQDALENLFALIRQIHSNPTPAQFVAALKTVMLNNLSLTIQSANCERDENEFLVDLRNFLQYSQKVPQAQKPEPSSSSCKIFMSIDHNQETKMANEAAVELDKKASFVCSKALVYVTGYIVKRLLLLPGLHGCKECASSLNSDKLLDEHDFIDLKKYQEKSESLHFPSAGIIAVAQTATIWFEKGKPLKDLDARFIGTTMATDFEREIRTNCDFHWVTCTHHKETIISQFIDAYCRIFFTAWAKNFTSTVRATRFSKQK